MKVLNGKKTYLGIIGLILVALSEEKVVVLLPEWLRPYVVGAASVFVTLGLAHRVEKYFGRQH